MSTQYPLIEGNEVKLSLNEHSNVFDLSVSVRDEPRATVPNLAPAAIIEIGVRLLLAASYWMDPDEFETALKSVDPFFNGLMSNAFEE